MADLVLKVLLKASSFLVAGRAHFSDSESRAHSPPQCGVLGHQSVSSVSWEPQKKGRL